MKPKKHILVWLLGFLVLDFYANSIPFILRNFPDSQIGTFFITHTFSWLLFWLGFFLLAFLVGRYLIKVKGLSSFGLNLQKKWGKDLLAGFLLGFGIWAVKNYVYYKLGMFDITGFLEVSEIPRIAVLSLLASIFPAAMNDIAIRGYWYRYFVQIRFLGLFLIFSTCLYVMGDAWNEGFSWFNTFFSLFLGFSMAYTVVKTGAIWMSIGIHTGSNFVYRLMYGLDGQGIVLLDNFRDGVVYSYINLIFTACLFPLVYFLLRNRKVPVCGVEAEESLRNEPVS